MSAKKLDIAAMGRKDVVACAELSVRAFAEYEYFTNFFPLREERLSFMRALIASEYRTTRRRAHFLMGRLDNSPAAVADLFPPHWRKPSDLQYLTHGWLKVLRLPNQDVVKEWLAMDTKAGLFCHNMLGGSTWYLSSLTVDPSCQGLGLGKEMLLDVVVPYVGSHGGTRLCFFTNSESNVAFYQHLGFEVANYQELMCRGKRMGSWDFVLDI